MVFLILLLFGELYRLSLHPLDFAVDTNDATLITGINQLQTDGEFIYVNPLNEPWILKLNMDGTFVCALGGPGRGPQELGSYGPTAIAVHGNEIMVLDSAKKTMHRFRDCAHAGTFPLPRYQIHRPSRSASPFVFDDRGILIQTSPRNRALAAHYSQDGELWHYVGEIFPIDVTVLRELPDLNDTLWAADDSFYYCVFKYRPIMRVFDRNFELVNTFRLDGPEIRKLEQNRQEPLPKYLSQRPPLFTDFQEHGPHLYGIIDGALYQFEKTTGKTTAIGRFYGEGPHFENLDINRDMPLKLIHFCITPSGLVILSEGVFLWDHDLWLSQPSFITSLADQ